LSALEVARITRPHGIRGVVHVELHWAGSESLNQVERLTLVLASGAQQAYELEWLKPAGKGYLAKFAGVDDRNGADTLRGARVLVERTELPPLEEGEAYLVDLIGAEVVAPDGVVGEVVRVETHPSIDTLVIRRPDGTLVEQAVAPAFIAHLDVAARRVELKNRDGLIE
jgi:16S rRNA processing protein RimM